MGPVVLWWIVFEAFGLIALPFTFALFSPRSSYGYPFGKILFVLLLSYLSWLLGYVLPMPVAVYGTLAGLTAASAFLALKNRQALATWLAGDGWRAMLRHDLIWTGGFLFFAWQRSVNPQIVDQEKFMDFAFYNLLARTDTMPPQDPWMSGQVINYYYFGYLTFANLARLMPLPIGISYNLCVATISGLAFAQTAAVVLQVTRSWGLGVLGAMMSLVLGNVDGFLQFLEKRTVRGMDFWRSSRLVGRYLDPQRDASTINEFPFFSSIHGDLHGHFMVLPVSVALLGVLLDERLFPSRRDDQSQGRVQILTSLGLMAFLFATMVAFSTWELPMGALVIALLASRSLLSRRFVASLREQSQPLLAWLKAHPRDTARAASPVIGVFACFLLYLPFYLAFQKPPGGVEVKFAQSSLAEFLTMFGILLFPLASMIAVRTWRRLSFSAETRQFVVAAAVLLLLVGGLAGNAVFPFLAILGAGALFVAFADAEDDERALYLLAAAGLAAVFACEIIYMKDSYGERLYRMNTVFKFYFQAWILLSVAAPWAIGQLLGQRWSWPAAKPILQALVAFSIVAAACYPLGVTLDRMSRPQTLDGNDYLRRQQPDDFAAIQWLRENVRDLPVILEASGNPYSYFARISSNTGLPTVLGWANHEGLWRGHSEEVGKRSAHVERMYNLATLAEAAPLLDQYQVRYVVLGDLERKQYKTPGLQKFETLKVAFRQGGTTIYER